MGIRPVWSESSLLSAWRKLGSLTTHWAHSEDSDQTGQMSRLICVFTGHTVILLVFSWGGSFSGPYCLLKHSFIIFLEGGSSRKNIWLHSKISYSSFIEANDRIYFSNCLRWYDFFLEFILMNSNMTEMEATWGAMYFHLQQGLLFEPRHDKTCLREFRPGQTQTGLRSHRS